MRATANILSDGQRLHLQHGPSDLIVWAEGARDQAYRAAAKRFETIIAEIASELAQLREMLHLQSERPRGSVAQRMHDACLPYSADVQVTRLAAVAGGVADEILEAMTRNANVSRAYVNNGGDIAFCLTPGTSFTTAIKGHDGQDLGRIHCSSEDGVGGMATSGRHGRSLSLGIADSVTVLARSAAQADVAATLIANAVDLPGHPAVTRRAACDVHDQSDLGDLPVTVGCGDLSAEECKRALGAGRVWAEAVETDGLISSAALFLQGYSTITGNHFQTSPKEQQYVQA